MYSLSYLSLNPESRISRLNIIVFKNYLIHVVKFPFRNLSVSQAQSMQTCSPSSWEAEAGGMPTGSRPAWCKYWEPGQARALEQDFVQKQRNKHKTPHNQTNRKQTGVSNTAHTSVEIYQISNPGQLILWLHFWCDNSTLPTTVTVPEGHPVWPLRVSVPKHSICLMALVLGGA